LRCRRRGDEAWGRGIPYHWEWSGPPPQIIFVFFVENAIF